MDNSARRAGLVVLCSILSGPAIAQEAIEEIVVTGSYLKKDNFDSSSPLTVIDSEAITANATPNLGELMSQQTFNYGSDFQTNTYAARGQGGTTTTANLRGLGARATLNLIDGKRLNFAPNTGAGSNLNNALPQIAIERIDVLKDGASAIYGTDAVAGVVNIVTKKNFDGLKFSVFHTQDKDNDFDENHLEVLFGTETGSGHFTFAASYRDRGELRQTDRPEFLREGFERSGTGNPGDWLVPNRDATGALTGDAARMADPGCGVDNGPGGTDVGSRFNWRSGDRNPTGTNCRLHFGEWWNYMNPVKQTAIWSNFSHDFNENLSNDFDIFYTRLDTESRGSAQNPGGRTEEFPIVLGDHPGNPFRAMADSNGDDVLEPLYAQDVNGDGIPDRGTADANGDGVPDVLLTATPFDAGSGIPFNEDVDVVALRIYGKLGTRPSALDSDGANTGNATFDEKDLRITDTLTFTVPDSSWEISLSGIYDRVERVFRQKNTSQSALVAGLMGELKASPVDPTTSYWNPFSTVELNCVDRVCANTGTASFENTLDVMNAVDITANDVLESIYQDYTLIAVGDLFEWQAGTVGMAVGAQYRKTRWDVDLNEAYNRCDWHEGGCGFDYRASQSVNSAFFELAIPLMDSDSLGYAEVQVAGRYEDYDGGIGGDFNPKFAGLWQPTEWLSIRGSWSSAFIAPSLEDLYEPEDCGLQTASDPLTGDLSQSFRVACVAGNSELEPETADVWNVGFSLQLLEGDLNLGMDYSSFDFQDRIAETTMNQVLSRDFNNFVAAGNTPGDAADIAAWIAPGGGSDPAIQRDTTGVLTRVTTSLLNAQEMKHKAFDFYARYNLNTDSIGSFFLNLDATLVDEYSYDLGFGIPPGDGVGKQNESVAEVPPIPEWRITGTVNWSLRNHAAMLRLRWLDEVEIDFNSGALQAAQVATRGSVMKDMLYTDLSYSYTFPSLFGEGRPTTIEAGGRNVFDEYPDPILNLGGIETFLYDIRGRMWYLRVTQEI